MFGVATLHYILYFCYFFIAIINFYNFFVFFVTVMMSLIYMYRLFFFSLIFLVSSGVTHSQSLVEPDGTTQTTVSSDGLRVILAPVDSLDISHNRYDRFSVSGDGLSLDNRGVNANIIVNEVTSTHSTLIEGVLSVLDTRIDPSVDVIISNPNGITVDGGGFQNIRHLGLTTGAITIDSTTDTVTSTIGDGLILIEESGLSGMLDELSLVSREVRILGLVRHILADDASHLNVITGSGVVSYDSDSLVSGAPWTSLTTETPISRDEVSVDISGMLSTGRVTITSSALGSGVRISGDHLATSGDFRVTSSGSVELTGISLTSEGSVILSGSSVTLGSSTDDTSEITSTIGDIEITSSGDVEISDTELTTNALTIDSPGSSRFDSSTITTSEEFVVEVHGSLSFDETTVTSSSFIDLDASDIRFGSDDVSSLRTELRSDDSGIVLRSRSGDITNFGSEIEGSRRIDGDGDSLGGVTIHSSGDLLNRSLSPELLGVFFGRDDDLYIRTSGDIRNETGRLFSNEDVTIRSSGDIYSETNFTGDSTPLSVRVVRGSRSLSGLFLKRKRTVYVSGGGAMETIPGEQSRIFGIGDVTITANSVRNIGGSINGASVTIDSATTFVNEAREVGTYSYVQSCLWFCENSGSSTLGTVGGIVSASGDLRITAPDSVTNLAGSLGGSTGIEITTSQFEFLPVLRLRPIEHPSGATGLFRGSQGYLLTELDFGSLESFGGDITINGSVIGDGTISSRSDVSITGSRIESDSASLPDTPSPFESRPVGIFWNLLF